jgi:hypothetical protein
LVIIQDAIAGYLLLLQVRQTFLCSTTMRPFPH